ncbi:MAG: hypothetical protein K2I67_02650 [Malacoplasma sp.]|nr:hypothetical protein [Malacoplasma sp.]
MWKKDKKIFELLNIHYNLELGASNAYKNFATTAKKWGYDYLSEFMSKMGNDKTEAHLPRIFEYFRLLDEEIKINQYSIPKQSEATNVKQLIEEMINIELQIRKHVNYIADYALQIKDYETFECLQWFIKDAIKDVHDISDVQTYVNAENATQLNIETAIHRKIKELD